MLVSDLQERLRLLVRKRIDAGDLTGTELARRAGFQQAHVSNFLNARRGLSIETMDRVLQVLGVNVYDLLDKPTNGITIHEPGFDEVPLVSMVALTHPTFPEADVEERLKFRKNFLRRLRPDAQEQRASWERFALIRIDKESGEAMRPRLLPGATLLIDRHYNTLTAYRKDVATMFVVRKGDDVLVRYVELQGRQLSLRPENPRAALDFVPIQDGESYHDYIIGRVAHIAIET